jgi:hypothetical protein
LHGTRAAAVNWVQSHDAIFALLKTGAEGGALGRVRGEEKPMWTEDQKAVKEICGDRKGTKAGTTQSRDTILRWEKREKTYDRRLGNSV